MHTEGIHVDNVQKGGLAEQAGLLPGDTLVSINAHKLRDVIDFIYFSADEKLTIGIKRDGKNLTLTVDRGEGDEFGIDFRPFRVMTCKNNCIFCFVKQLPKGLRKTLYVKDEDYRMSFLYGNYITLSNLRDEDRIRIAEQKLSPLYISVHSTNKSLRSKLLGSMKNPDILKELKFFADNKVRFNVQIVLCPGYNDGKELQQTLANLYKFHPYLLSVAVVPVGLTMHRKQQIRPVEKEDAEDALRIIESFQKRFLKKHGNPIIYGADELYLKAGWPFPSLREYGELHQVENGVGMVPLFLSRTKRLKWPKTLPQGKKFLTFTGMSFYPFLKKFADKISEKEDIEIDVMPVENKFFGPSITVAGLLTGRDVIRAALGRPDGHEAILVPDVVLNGEDIFLDDISLHDVEEALSIPVRKIESTPEGFLRGITEKGKDFSSRLLTDGAISDTI
jgi:putative radical SAM enzyme (TIGR03279 family)